MVLSEVLSVEVTFHFTLIYGYAVQNLFLFQIHGSDRFVLGLL